MSGQVVDMWLVALAITVGFGATAFVFVATLIICEAAKMITDVVSGFRS